MPLVWAAMATQDRRAPRPCLDLALNDGRVAARERNIVLVGGASVSAVREHERDRELPARVLPLP